jgi:GNAT superfamily N-acetyltransferase
MLTTTDAMARNAMGVTQLILDNSPKGWSRRDAGVLSGIAGVNLAPFNGVWVEQADVSIDGVENRLDEVAQTGLPYILQARPSAAARIGAIATSRGMTAVESAPFMVLDGPTVFRPAPIPSGLSLRVLDPGDTHAHMKLFGEVFELPSDVIAQLTSTGFLDREFATVYLGDIGGMPVTTALAVTRDNVLSLFSICTVESERGRGIGAAITSRAIADAFDRGVAAVWLHASPLGLPVYERLGFTTREHWPTWVAPS